MTVKKGSNRCGETSYRKKGQYSEGSSKMLPILICYHHFSATGSGISKKTLKTRQEAY